VNSRIEFLKKREQEIRAQLAAEQTKSRRRAEREAARTVEIVGKAVIQMAAQSPEGFGVMLKQVLGATVIEERARDLLRRNGVL